MKKTVATIVLAVATSFAFPAMANDYMMHKNMHGNMMPMKPSASTKAFMHANQKMHKDMMIRHTGNTDVDFVRSMIPHHQGAIDMARVQLKYGRDPALRQLAKEIIAAQEKEIREMKAWLARYGKHPRHR